MNISPVNISNIKYSPAFSSQVKKRYEENPISTTMEKVDVVKASIIAGVGFGIRALLYLMDDGFVGEKILNESEKLVKNAKKGLPSWKKDLMHLGSFGALLAGFVGLVAIGYALYNAPKSLYQGKINAFKKTKEMDQYIIGNKVETELYNQMHEKAKNATEEEKAELKEQYFKLRASKNNLPEFLKNAVKLPAN